MGLYFRDLAYRDVAAKVLDKLGGLGVSYFHRFDPKGKALPWLIRSFLELDLEGVCKARGPDEAFITSLWRVLDRYKRLISKDDLHYLKLLIPKRDTNSPLKRINLFLRWTARREYPDLGILKTLNPSKLKVPLGNEIARVAGRVFYGRDLDISRRSRDIVTRILRSINNNDPIKYHIVLSRPALLGWCLKNPELSHCWLCPLKNICKYGRTRERTPLLYNKELSLRITTKIKTKKTIHKIHELLKGSLSRYIRGLKRDIVCSFEEAINHELRPDLLCRNKEVVIAEAKISTHNKQGPQQLKAYIDQLLKSGIKEIEAYLAYYKVDQDDLTYIKEAFNVLGIENLVKKIEILGYDIDTKALRPLHIAP